MKHVTSRFFLAIAAVFMLSQGCKKDKEDLSVRGVSLSKSTATLKPGATEQLTFTVFPENAGTRTEAGTFPMQRFQPLMQPVLLLQSNQVALSSRLQPKKEMKRQPAL